MIVRTMLTKGSGTARGLRLVRVLSVGILVIGVWGLVATSGAGAQQGDAGTTGGGTTINPNTFNLSAQANALDVLLTDPSLPLSGDLAYELGPWGASSSINSLGQSMADAGAPYSPSVASLPGTIAGIGPGVPPLPPIPGYVSASYPGTPTNHQSQAGYDINSTASSTTSKGTVSLGTQPSGSPNPTLFASAETTANSDGSVNLTASAGMDVLDFGQLLDLGNVSSSLSMTQQPNQQPDVMDQTNLGTVTLLGQATGLVTKGLSALGVGVPINLNSEVIGTLDTLLANTGLTLTYLPETFGYTDGTSSTGSSPNTSKTLQSIDSGALQVSFSKNIPSQGVVRLSLTLGRVYLSTMDSPGLLPTSDDSGVVGNDTVTGATTFPLGGTTGTVAGTSVVPSAGPTPARAPTTTVPSHLPTGPAFAVEHGPPINSVYLFLLLSALALLLASQAARYLAVRLALSGRGI
jgi:hypothetical protein